MTPWALPRIEQINSIFMTKKNVTFKFNFKSSEDSSGTKKFDAAYNGNKDFKVKAPKYFSTILIFDSVVNYYVTVA